MSAAIVFHPEGYTTQGQTLMGRQAAGEAFLRAVANDRRHAEHWVQVESGQQAAAFVALLRTWGDDRPVKVIDRLRMSSLAEPGVLYCPGPGLGSYAWRRSNFGHRQWSLCGITHTTASAGAMDALADLAVAPMQPWDALICTSRAVHHNVMQVVDAQVEYLLDRTGGRQVPLPRFPIIPLGVHAADFVFDARERSEARRSIGASEDSIVVLYVGRLSFHAKAHPAAMYQALELAKEAAGSREVILLECGWHANAAIGNAFATGARMLCPGVRQVSMDGRVAMDRRRAWACADVFCSLSDNVQETFGLTPLEAMAAGLPVVVSDWDGYRDTVRDGVDGFCVPTAMPGPGHAADIAWRHALGIESYDRYCGHLSAMVSMDINAAAKAFKLLFESPALRHQMGNAGRARARATFDWALILERYQSLWSELEDLRRSHVQTPALRRPWPARMDPCEAFASYPTMQLVGTTVVALPMHDLQALSERRAMLMQLSMVNFAAALLPSDQQWSALLTRAASGPVQIDTLLAPLGEGQPSLSLPQIALLLKYGLLERPS